MGLSYSYVVVISPTAESHLRELMSGWQLSSQGEFVTLDFPLDETLLHYLRHDVIGRRRTSNRSWQSPSLWVWLSRGLRFRTQDYPEFFPNATTGRVAGFHVLSWLHPATQQLYVSFEATTWRMSLVLQQSASIRQWFLDLATQLAATAVFLDLEAEGFEFIYYQGYPIAATFTEDLHVQQAPESNRQALEAICWNYADRFE